MNNETWYDDSIDNVTPVEVKTPDKRVTGYQFTFEKLTGTITGTPYITLTGIPFEATVAVPFSGGVIQCTGNTSIVMPDGKFSSVIGTPTDLDAGVTWRLIVEPLMRSV